MRHAALALLLAFATPAAAQVPLDAIDALAPLAPVLKRNVTVSDDIVRIGDLIDNAGKAASIAIFRAPDLGTTGSVPAAQVLQAARAHGVIAVDTAGTAEVLVTRRSRSVGAREVEAAIAQAIAQKVGLPADSQMAVRLDRDMHTVQVDATDAAALQVMRLAFDARSGHFDALVEVPGNGRRHALRFSGRATEMVEVVALARPLARGEILRAGDVVTERRPKSEAGANLAATVDRVVGLATRRAMRAGDVLRSADLARPELVERNENVTLLFEGPGILLTSRAKALESGAEGDLISVLNVHSKRTVQGVVSGPNTVTVTSMKPRIAAVASADPATPRHARAE